MQVENCIFLSVINCESKFSASPCSRVADYGFRLDIAIAFIKLFDTRFIIIHIFAADQMYGYAAKAAAGKSGTQRSGQLVGKLHYFIQSGGGIFKVHFAAFVRIPPELTEAGQISGSQQLDCTTDPFALFDHMSGAKVFNIGQQRFFTFQKLA